LRNSRRNGVCRSSCDGYTGFAHPWQLYGSCQIPSAFEMTNASESSPFFGHDGFEIQLQALYKTDIKVKRMPEEQMAEKEGATMNSTNQVKEFYGGRNSQKELLPFKGEEAPQHTTPISN
jgi:hypothetical protein